MSDTKHMTAIEWTHAPGFKGETWNPITGCTKVGPECDHCYMFREYPRLHALGNLGYPAAPDVVTLLPDRLAAPLRWGAKQPRMVFVCSMSDLFHSAVPDEYILKIFNVMAALPWHRFLVLTKRTGRMLHFARNVWPQQGGRWDPITPIGLTHGVWPGTKWPSNVWAGTTVGTARNLPKLDQLVQVPAPVRFVSAEPLLGPLDLTRWMNPNAMDTWDPLMRPLPGGTWTNDSGKKALLEWVIVGGESGPDSRPTNPDWARTLRDQCQEANVPFFFKQWGEWSPAGPDPSAKWYSEGKLQRWGDTHTSILVGRANDGKLLDATRWNEFPMVAG